MWDWDKNGLIFVFVQHIEISSVFISNTIMKNLSLLLMVFFLCSFPLFAQETKTDPSYAATLQQGEALKFGNKAVKFKKVISDSRCPKDVTCMWAGEAKVLIEVYGEGDLVEEKVVTIGSSFLPLSLSAEGLQYFLNSSYLLPYPTTENKSLDKDYTLGIMVRENRVE